MNPSFKQAPCGFRVCCTYCGWKTTATGMILPTKRSQIFSEFVKCPLCGAELVFVDDRAIVKGRQSDLMSGLFLREWEFEKDKLFKRLSTVSDLIANPPLSEPSRESPEPPPPLGIDKDFHELYAEALSELSEENRRAIIARVDLGLNWEQIADALDMRSEAEARIAVSRAVRRLARVLARHFQAIPASVELPRRTLRERLRDFFRRLFGSR